MAEEDRKVEELASLLTAEERARIRAEEMFRRSVRSEFEKLDKKDQQQSIWSQVWLFLNSAFGLFFFGTIVVGLATWAAGFFEKQSQLTIERAALVHKLDAELSFRLSPLTSLFEGDSLNERVQAELASVVFSSDPPSKHSFMVTEARSLYPEFRERNLASLFLELRFTAPKEREKDILNAMKETQRFERMLKVGQKKEINLAEHVIDEITVLSHEHLQELKTNIIPAFRYWVELR